MKHDAIPLSFKYFSPFHPFRSWYKTKFFPFLPWHKPAEWNENQVFSPFFSQKLHGHHCEMMNVFLSVAIISALFKRCNEKILTSSFSILHFHSQTKATTREEKNATFPASFRNEIVFRHWNDPSASFARFVFNFLFHLLQKKKLENNELNFIWNVPSDRHSKTWRKF